MKAVRQDALLATAAVVALQVLLPRIFSVLLWYHLAFLAVSLAMLGFALGGVIVRRRDEALGQPGGGLDRPALLAASSLSILGALALAVRLPIDASALLDEPLDALLLLMLVAGLAVPFVLLGSVVCSTLDLAGERLGPVYAASFLGGALGAAACLGAMQAWGCWRAIGVVALVPLLGCLGRPRPAAVAALLLALVAIAAPHLLVPRTSRKHFPRVPLEQVLAEHSDATSEVIFYRNPDHHGLWSAAADPSLPVPDTIGVAIDAWAITFITRRDGPDDYPALLQHHPAGLAYVNTHPGFEALVLGAGGGWDVLGALAKGARHVTAVELDPFIVDAVRGRWGDYSGHLYDDPRVTAVVSEARRFVEHDSQRYDRIVLAGVDTFAATQAGAFALAENDLYTVEACDAYLAHLRPGGMLFMTRWWFEPPRQSVRLLLTVARSLRAAGVPDPRRRIYLAQGGNSLLLVRPDADFTPNELDQFDAQARARGASTVYAWGHPSHPVLVEALDAKDPAAWARAYPYRVDPVTDDRPFFFENGRLSHLFEAKGNWIHDRLGGQEVLVVTLVILGLLSLLLLSGARNRAAGGPWVALPFLALGAGYLVVEVSAMQRLVLLLGHPVDAVAVVLVSMLLWSGLGSLLSHRVAARAAPALCLAAALAVLLTLVAGHEWLTRLLEDRGAPVRMLAVGLFLGPAALCMGACFPLVLSRLKRGRTSLLPSAFLWNGVASVLAGPLAVMLAMDQGFGVTLIVGAGCYLLAGAATAVAARARPA